jgi:hypothetical protein
MTFLKSSQDVKNLNSLTHKKIAQNPKMIQWKKRKMSEQVLTSIAQWGSVKWL